MPVLQTLCAVLKQSLVASDRTDSLGRTLESKHIILIKNSLSW